MKRQPITSLIAIVTVFGLSACSLISKPPSAGDVVDLGLSLNGKPLDKVTSDPEATDKILSDLFGPGFTGEEGREKLKVLLQTLDEGKPLGRNVTAFRGVCGFSTAEFVRAVVSPKEKRKTKGLIGDYLVEFDRTYDEDDNWDGKSWPGHLTVDMRTSIFFTDESYKNDVADRTELLQWHIEVLKKGSKINGFEVLKHSGDPFDPFPGTVVFPDEALGPGGDIADRGLNRKLWAKGPEIVVRHIYQKIDDGPVTRLPNTHEFYKSCEESCVDMMTKGFPPTYRINFPEQSGYCLGRCAHPFIINSM